jgi:hypothetical protein
MGVTEQLSRLESLLRKAQAGDEESVCILRDYVAECARKTPTSDLIAIADFVTDFLRRHVKDYVSRN